MAVARTEYENLRNHLHEQYADLSDERLERLMGRYGMDAAAMEDFYYQIGKIVSLAAQTVLRSAPSTFPVAGLAAGGVMRGDVTPTMAKDAENDTDPLDPFPTSPFGGELSVDAKMTVAFATAIQDVKADHAFAALPNVADLPIIIVALKSDGTRPFVGRHVDEMFYSGSLLKLAAMYAAFQLRLVVNQFVTTLDTSKITTDAMVFAEIRKAFDKKIMAAAPDLIKSCNTTGNRPPQYEKVFTPSKDSAGKWQVAFLVDSNMGKDFAGNLEKMVADSHTASAGICIQALGFSWIDGLLQKAGFFDPRTKRGIWLAGDYLDPQFKIDAAHAFDVAHHVTTVSDRIEEFNLGISGWQGVRIPNKNDRPSMQATTCIDLARLLVLAFDSKLVPDFMLHINVASLEMISMMGKGVDSAAAGSIMKRFPSGTAAPFTVLQSKIGVGTLGTTGSCNANASGQTRGCVLSEAAIVQEAAAAGRQFVVVYQNVKDTTNDNNGQIARIRAIVEKTMAGFP
jgi:hypothetical protein